MNRFELADAMIKGLHTPNVKEETMAYISISNKTGFCGHVCPNCQEKGDE